MGKKATEKPSKALAILQSLVDQVDELEIKGAKSSYCSVNGNMICFMASHDRLALRLDKNDRETFLEQYDDCVCIEHATVMKDYVLVPNSVLTNNRKLKPLWKKCLENAYSLRAKPTKKKAKKKK